jgi:hypothetical protein
VVIAQLPLVASAFTPSDGTPRPIVRRAAGLTLGRAASSGRRGAQTIQQTRD